MFLLRRMSVLVASVCALVVVSWGATALAVPLPYAETFESEPTCSTACGSACVLSTSGVTNETGDDLDWTVDGGGTPSPGTGPLSGFPDRGQYLYVEASFPCNTQAKRHISCLVLELAGTTTPTVSFWYHMLGARWARSTWT